jgi:hypothetical protein
MSETPSLYPQAEVEQAQGQRDGLVVECLILLLQVSRRPNALKLLAGVKEQLQLFAGYKANRRR